MTAPQWPAELQQRLLKDGFADTLADGRIRTKTDIGPGKVRLSSTSAIRPVAGRIKVDDGSKARFDRFWMEETKGGILPFFIPDQARDGLLLAGSDGATLLDMNGLPILVTAWWLVRFGASAPVTSPAPGLFWTISFPLEVLP